MEVYVDCQAVVSVAKQLVTACGERNKFAGAWKSQYLKDVVVKKVKAHASKEEAQAEGWCELWDGNDRADQVAKNARVQAVKWRRCGRISLRIRKKCFPKLKCRMTMNLIWNWRLNGLKSGAFTLCHPLTRPARSVREQDTFMVGLRCLQLNWK